MKSRRNGALVHLGSLGLFLALAPGVCLALDTDHLLPHADCPLCGLLSLFAAVIAVFYSILLCSHHVRPVPAIPAGPRYRVYLGGPTSARDPPLPTPTA